MIKLHYHPLSTFSRRVHIALLEKGIPFETITVDMPNRAHKSKEYLRLNPYGRVPTIVEDDGFTLYESTAILEYLEATHPTPALLPKDARQRALAAMHMKVCDIEIGTATGTLIFPKRFLPKEKWNEASMADAKRRIERHLEIVEAELGEREWLVGGAYSLVEVCYTPFVEFLELMEIAPPPAVKAWAARMLDRPHAKATKPAI
jgi:glutathione S-transferase